MGKHAQSIDSCLIKRIQANGRGWVFTPLDFLDLGSRAAVGSALKRHKHAGTIRQLARGLYDYPRTHPKLGLLAPSIDAIAKALSGRDVIRLQPSGAYAANLLGLSDQVPMRIVFLTEGAKRHVQLGKQEIFLKHTAPRFMASAGKTSGLVIQALRYLGAKHVDEGVVATLKRKLTRKDKKELMKDVRYAPAWIAEVMRKIGESESA